MIAVQASGFTKQNKKKFITMIKIRFNERLLEFELF